MHVLITRPERDAADLKSRIEALGCEVTIAPLIEVALNIIPANHIPENTPERANVLVATSRNGLRALAQSPGFKAALSLPLFAVGPATAALARELGFKIIITGAGTAADLVPLIKDDMGTRSGTVAHLAGEHLAFDLGAALNAKGLTYQRIKAYRSVAAETLDVAVRQHLENRTLDAVTLMSPRTARVWTNLIRAMPDRPDLTHLTHVCLSHAVAQALKPLAPVRIEISKAPNAIEIVALVYRLAGRRKTG